MIGVSRKTNKKKWGHNVQRMLQKILEIDPVGPFSEICNRLGANLSLYPQCIAEAMRRESQLGNGRYYEKSTSWWWKPKKRRVPWYDNVFYVTKEQDLLLGWTRHRGCDPYRFFILLSDESLEVFFAKMYRWEYIPTPSVWQGLESKEVIEYLEW